MCLNWNLKTKLFNILRRKSLILKLGQLFEKYIRKIFKEKYTRHKIVQHKIVPDDYLYL